MTDCGGMTLDELEASLSDGWAWLDLNPRHPQRDEFERRWIARLRRYEACVPKPQPTDCPHEQLDGMPDVGRKGEFWRCAACGQVTRDVPDRDGPIVSDGLRYRRQIWGYAAVPEATDP